MVGEQKVCCPPSSQVTMMLNQKGANRCICWCSCLSATVTNVCSLIGCTLLAETPTIILSNIQNVSPQQCGCFFVHRLNHICFHFLHPTTLIFRHKNLGCPLAFVIYILHIPLVLIIDPKSVKVYQF